MDQRGALLWYHDHVMGVTRFGVYAGMAGLWIVRDERERELGLPEGPPLEVPLLIQDRNFDLDRQGRLTGRLVHKTDPEVMEAFAPFTIVNAGNFTVQFAATTNDGDHTTFIDAVTITGSAEPRRGSTMIR